MAESKVGVQTRSMVDAQHIEEEIPNQIEHQPVQMNTNNPAIALDHPTANLN